MLQRFLESWDTAADEECLLAWGSRHLRVLSRGLLLKGSYYDIRPIFMADFEEVSTFMQNASHFIDFQASNCLLMSGPLHIV